MTLPNGFAPAPGNNLRPLYLLNRDGLDAWRGRQPQPVVQLSLIHI